MAQPIQPFQQFDNRDYVSMTMEFRCNLRCVHCMIEGTMDRLKPESADRFSELLAVNAREKRWKGLILTGSEITLRRDLPQLATRARASGFEHVRIQTHGMRLGEAAFAKTLVDSGIDEYFVSVAGADASSHDTLTQVPGSFDGMMAGMNWLDRQPGVRTMTNTVVTERSYRMLPDIVRALGHLRQLAQMEFWIYWPMREDDEKNLIAPYPLIKPYLMEAVALARSLGRGVEVKNFPECMLGELGPVLRNVQPQLYTDEAFWPEFMRNGFYQCVWRERCTSVECLGLSTAYIRKFGLEEAVLKPLQ